MKTIWNKGLTAQKREELKRDFDASATTRERLKVILEEKIESSRSSVRQSNTYDSPSWALLQADSIGYERAMHEIISIISEK